jgi:hypothetical protein
MGTSNTLLKAAGAVTGLLGGFLTGLWEIFLSPTYVGSTLIPLSPVLAAITNFLLIWYARRVTGSAALSLLPGVVWFGTMLLGASGGPGGDVLLPGDAAGRMGLIALLVGAAVWAVMAYRQVLNRAAPAGFTGPGSRRAAAGSGRAARSGPDARSGPAGRSARASLGEAEAGAGRPAPAGGERTRAGAAEAAAGPDANAGASANAADANPGPDASAGATPAPPGRQKAAGSRPKSSARRPSSKSPRPGGRR